MEDVVRVASYICQRYEDQFGCRIDEMKLHKLLYFIQRECIIQTGKPMFPEKFEAWKYGPVMVAIRQYYKEDRLQKTISSESKEEYKPVFDKVFDMLAGKDAWSLSTLTHGEYSWQKARHGYKADDFCTVKMETGDIRKDAERIRARRFLFKDLRERHETFFANFNREEDAV